MGGGRGGEGVATQIRRSAALLRIPSPRRPAASAHRPSPPSYQRAPPLAALRSLTSGTPPAQPPNLSSPWAGGDAQPGAAGPSPRHRALGPAGVVGSARGHRAWLPADRALVAAAGGRLLHERPHVWVCVGAAPTADARGSPAYSVRPPTDHAAAAAPVAPRAHPCGGGAAARTARADHGRRHGRCGGARESGARGRPRGARPFRVRAGHWVRPRPQRLRRLRRHHRRT